VLRQIEAAALFAPLHTPASLAVIAHARALFAGLPQVACFDTAFHATLPDAARVLPIPTALQAQGIQRYGFHGLSCESILFQLAREGPHGVPERLLIAHLGHGASVTAVRAGRSVDTSMGLTPSGGLIMGTRSGDLDPGVLIHLLRLAGGDAARLAQVLDRQSGLLGISGLSSDMRRLHEAEPGDADARLAVHMFCVAVAKQLAAMATVLGGMDLIVFSGGIGQNDAQVRAAVCAALGWFGVALDARCNEQGQGAISAATSRCAVRVVASREDEQIARHCAALLQAAPR
jgi:acetate kinase